MTKQHILQEIKRIALANGGLPPGHAKFYSETGIKQTDWSGKHWVRWSEALKEAGFAPNQMTSGYEKSFLIEKLIGLAREVGHFPVTREIRIKAFKDRGFPSTKTYETHFGLKSQLVSKVVEYCRQHTGFEDVLRMCEEISSQVKRPEISEEESDLDEEFGFVYLIKSGRFYKIGKSNSIGRREYELAIQLPEKTKTIHAIRTDDPAGIEAYWHKRFAAKRANGEWFDLTASDVKAFKRRQFM